MSGQATAELRKLAHTLDVSTADLDMVASLSAEDLRELRQQVGEALFQADKHYFARVAALSKAVPTAVSAKLTEAVLPPLIAARTAELLEPRKAADLVSKISPGYLARVSAYMDAARAPEVIAAIPAERIAEVGAELARREEWIVIGSFVSVVTAAALAASVAEFNGEQLLRIGFVMEDVSRLDEIGGLLTDRQIDELLAAAAVRGLWPELAELIANLSTARLARLAKRYAAADERVRTLFERAADSGELAPQTLATLR